MTRSTSTLAFTALLAVAAGGCFSPLQRAVGRRPTVLVAGDDSACQPAALETIRNVGRCRVQLVASDQTGGIVRSSGWIEVDGTSPRFDLPAQFAWVTLEIDPGCEHPRGVVRYARVGNQCAAVPAQVATAE